MVETIWGIMIGCILAIVWVMLMVAVKGKDGGRDPNNWAWIDVVYAFGYVKLFITCVKYTPQIWTNYKRQSTVGWSIRQVLLDLAGGILSLAQLGIDARLEGSWKGVTGNPVKFGRFYNYVEP